MGEVRAETALAPAADWAVFLTWLADVADASYRAQHCGQTRRQAR